MEEASIDSLGNPTTSDCDDPVISPDGQSVAFRCLAPMTNHAATDQVYVRDLVAGTTKLASINETGAIANSTDSRPTAMTINGDVLIVEASADNLGAVPGGFPQVFRIPISYWEESGSTCAAADTTCDGVDDDCDGQIDEDYDPEDTVCGVGACASSGSTSCVDGEVVYSCVPGTPSGGEVCDGVDNDCNGIVDDDAQPVQVSCQVGGCTAVATGPCDATPDCTAVGVCVSEADCTDAADNDGDGLSDCDDTDCLGDGVCANGAPVLDPVPVTTVTVGQTLNFALSGSDPDGDPVTFGVAPLPLPANATLDGQTGEFLFTPTLSQVSSFALDFTASDGRDVATQTTVITVMAPIPGGPTALTGFLYDAVDAAEGNPTRPVVGAAVRDLADPENPVFTDTDGRFTLSGLVPGEVTIEFNGATAAPPPQPDPPPDPPVVYGSYRATMVVESGTTKEMFRPVFVPRIDGPEEQVVAGSATTLTNPGIPDVVVVVPADEVVDDDGQPYTGTLRVSSVPPEFTPGALPDTLNPATVLTIQPMGIRFTEPAPVTFPNELGLAPGSEVDLWSLDHSTGEFEAVGVGVVSADGSLINSRDGDGILETSWHFPAPPAPEEEDEDDGTGDDEESEGGSDGGGAGSDSGGEGDPEQPNDPDDVDRGDTPEPDPCSDVASSVPLGKGKVRVELRMPAYKMLDDPFSHKLVYDSSRAFPYYLLPVNSKVVVRSAVPPIVSYESTVGGVFANDTRYVDTTGFVEDEDEPFRVVVGVDASDRDTGVVPVRIRMTSHFPIGETGTDATFGNVLERSLPVINGRGSPFGAGWDWSGVRRLVPVGPEGQDLLMIQGGGGYRTFRLLDGAFVSSAGDASTLVENADGTFALRRIDGVVTEFDAEGRQTRIEFPNNIEWQYNYNTEGQLSEIIDGAGGLTTIDYQDGLIRRVTDPANRETEFEHDNGDLVRVEFSDGSDRRFGYDADHLMTSETSPRGFTKHRIFDSAGRIQRVVLEDQNERLLTPASTIGFIPPTSDLGRTKEDAAPFVRPDRITTVEDAEGRLRSFEIGRYGQVIRATDTAGLVTTYDRDSDGNLLRVAKPSGQAFSMRYDGNKNMLTRTDEALEATTVYTHEPLRNQVETITDGEDHTTRFMYFPSGSLEKIISPLDREVAMTYYPDGTVETITDPLSRVTHFEYDLNGNLDTVTVTAGGQSRVTRLGNASSGYPESITNPLMESVSIPRNDWNRPTTVTDDASNTTELSYDDSGNLETLIPPFSASVEPRVHTFLHDVREWNEGYVPPAIMGQDLRTTLVRNREKQVKLEQLPDGRTISYSHDEAGRLETTTIERGVYTNEYDADTGLVTRMTAPEATPLGLSYLGDYLRSAKTDSGEGVAYRYEGTGRVDSLTVLAPVPACESPSTVATWPGDGSLEDPIGGYNAAQSGGVTYEAGVSGGAFSFDGQDDFLTASVPTLDGATQLSFSLWLRMLPGSNESKTFFFLPDTSGLRAFRFDTRPGNRLVAEFLTFFPMDTCGGSVCTADLDYRDGQWHHLVATMEFVLGQLVFRLYFDGQQVDELATFNRTEFDTTGELRVGGFGVDGYEGGLDEIRIHDSALTPEEVLALYATGCDTGPATRIAFDYDADGAVERAGDVTMEYQPETGLLDSVSLGDLRTTFTYHPFGEVHTHTTKVQSTQASIYDVSYTPDALGRVSTKTETVQGVSTEYEYVYDNAGRLEEVWINDDKAEWYTYDPNGNRKTLNTMTQTLTAEYDEQDRLKSLGDATYTYREGGELLTRTALGDPPISYDYDELGNLLAVTLASGSVVEYGIDPVNRRVSRRVDGQTTHHWVYQDRLNPVAELDGDGNLLSLFVYGTRAHVPDAMIKDGTRYLFVTDQVGSVRLVLNTETGAVAQQTNYDAWGNVLAGSTNQGFQPFGFAGGLYDPATKLLRFGARDYDPASGRWTTKDPIGFSGGLTNLYAYGVSDPVNFFDPTGRALPFLLPAACWIAIGASGGGYAAYRASGGNPGATAIGAGIGGLGGAAGGVFAAAEVAAEYAAVALIAAAAAAPKVVEFLTDPSEVTTEEAVEFGAGELCMMGPNEVTTPLLCPLIAQEAGDAAGQLQQSIQRELESLDATVRGAGMMSN